MALIRAPQLSRQVGSLAWLGFPVACLLAMHGTVPHRSESMSLSDGTEAVQRTLFFFLEFGRAHRTLQEVFRDSAAWSPNVCAGL